MRLDHQLIQRIFLVFKTKVSCSFVQSQAVHIEEALVPQFVLEIVASDRAIDGDHVLVPVKLSKNFKELVEELDLIFELRLAISESIVVEHVNDKCVEAVSSHAC